MKLTTRDAVAVMVIAAGCATMGYSLSTGDFETAKLADCVLFGFAVGRLRFERI